MASIVVLGQAGAVEPGCRPLAYRVESRRRTAAAIAVACGAASSTDQTRRTSSTSTTTSSTTSSTSRPNSCPAGQWFAPHRSCHPATLMADLDQARGLHVASTRGAEKAVPTGRNGLRFEPTPLTGPPRRHPSKPECTPPRLGRLPGALWRLQAA
ncbi:MAG: hypothetical protein QOF30_3008 [Acidimicrobiaceae bacterium]|nr:hypothetical protein [Acidimicrobiaceae bacterium]